MKLRNGTLTWTCHICKRERPDDKISVITKLVEFEGRVIGLQNIRYCNDNPDCAAAAPKHSFWKED